MEENAQDVITMNRGDLKRLEPGEYLNDNIIDFKIKILMEELKVRRQCYFNIYIIVMSYLSRIC